MIGLVVVAHDHIGESMLAALDHVMGPQSLTAAMSVGVDADINADMHEMQKSLCRMVKRCDAGNGVLLFADMFGGTPCNLALSCMQEYRVEVVSGFNLPMLVKAASLRQSLNDLPLLARQVRESGRQHMHIASDLLNEKEHPHG
ncbi:MAG: PTS system fructose subfamily IIA component [Mariprofundaceae bacterium]|nr:PTS system fructose subfamily IIA component [Mariprofundaceae bacterium]